MEDTQKNTAIWYTVGAIVIILAAYLMFFRDPSSNTASIVGDTATTTVGELSATTTKSSITISDQVATSSATVDQIVTNVPVWVAIHEDLYGKPSNILGAAWVPAGESLNVMVELQRNAVAGGTYYAIIHADDGSGASDFDFKKDLPLTDTEGNPVMKTYKVLIDKN